MRLSAQNIAQGLQRWKRTSKDSFMACCPAHDDKNPSLHISESNEGLILVHCFSGCSQQAVIDELRNLGLWSIGDPSKIKARQYQAEYELAQCILSLAECDKQIGKDIMWTEYDKKVINDAEMTFSQINKNKLELIPANSIEPRSIEWLWLGWLATGKFHILAGSPGTGKTTLALLAAKVICCGGTWPDGSQTTEGNLLIFSGEDDPQDTLRPRLEVLGANLNRVYFIGSLSENGNKRPFNPATDIHELQRQAEIIGNVRLIIVDPVVNAVNGDSHKNTEVRRGLQPLVDLAQNIGAAILGITHLSKGSDARMPLERVIGSIAFSALPRVVWITQKSDEDNTFMLVRAKSNIGKDGDGFKYQIHEKKLMNHPDISASYVEFGEFIEGSAATLLSNTDPNIRPALNEAIDFLSSILSDNPLSAKIILEEATNAGIKPATLRRAKDKLGIKPCRQGFSSSGGWVWALPPIDDQVAHR